MGGRTASFGGLSAKSICNRAFEVQKSGFFALQTRSLMVFVFFTDQPIKGAKKHTFSGYLSEDLGLYE